MAQSPTSHHAHPRPALNRMMQYGALAVIAVILLSAPLQILLSLSGAPGGLFVLSAVATLLLIAPVILLTTATPPVTVSAEGLAIEPLVWKRHFVHWEDIRAIKDYTLLPPPETETGRRLAVGRKKYRPAEGKMLLIPSLPVQYRVTGFFAGEGFTPVIALTNRTHTDYETLIESVFFYQKGATK